MLWETAKIVIKEELKQENQRKLFEKLLFMTIRPEFNNGRLIRSFCSSFYSCFGCFGGSGGFVSVFRCFGGFGGSGGFVSVFRVLVRAACLRRLERVSYNLCTCQDNETKKFHAFSY